ncbi:MAG: hypothetical protein ACOYK8_06370 [Alphaproteobacteria bacterium]
MVADPEMEVLMRITTNIGQTIPVFPLVFTGECGLWCCGARSVCGCHWPDQHKKRHLLPIRLATSPLTEGKRLC